LEWLLNAWKSDKMALSQYKSWLSRSGFREELANVEGLFQNVGRLEFENYKLQSEINRLSSQQHSVEISIARDKISYNKDIIHHLKYDPNNVNVNILQSFLTWFNS
jgi:hypothetical protein